MEKELVGIPELLLRIAAREQRRLGIVTELGPCYGYLLGADATHLALYAQHRVHKDEVRWALHLFPRSLTVIIGDQRLEHEEAVVQEAYHQLVTTFPDPWGRYLSPAKENA